MAAPVPTPTLAVTQPHQFTYLFTDLSGNALAMLPLRSVSFNLALNQAGTFTGTLSIEDPQVRQGNWLTATQVNKACVWVDVTGVLVWGGVVQGQTYTMGQQTVVITASDFWGYMNQRLQAKDYATKWAVTPAGPLEISYTIISDALAKAGSLAISVVKNGVTPVTYHVTFAAPLSQQQTITSLVGQLQQLGWNVGFDLASDVAYVGGIPKGTITLSYPRRGRIAGTTGLVLSTANAVSFKYDVKGSSQANAVVEMATAAGAVSNEYVWAPSMATGYPLLEMLGMHTLFTATTEPQAVVNAWGANDLMLAAYPVATPQVKINLFGEPNLGDWIVGDDVRTIVPKTTDLPTNPRFPTGMDYYFRIVQAAVTVSDAGLVTVTFTLNVPPSSTPHAPPL